MPVAVLRCSAAGLAGACLALLAGCQSLPLPPVFTGPAVAPPAALHLDGVPPVPQALADRARPHLESAGHWLAEIGRAHV